MASPLKVLFLHGWHSVPGGVKPTYLKDHGVEVINPKLDDDDFELALRTAQMEFNQHQPNVIVGSSRGGAAALNIDSGNVPLVLLCPAWKNWGTAKRLKANSVILHSRHDDIIPFEDSEELIFQSNLSPETLIEVGGDHRLADPNSLAVMLWACQLLGSGQQPPWLDGNDLDEDAQQRRRGGDSQIEGSYICDWCGEEIVVPLDLSQGNSQEYVEDCPVCCNANIIKVLVSSSGSVSIWAEPEQDHDIESDDR